MEPQSPPKSFQVRSRIFLSATLSRSTIDRARGGLLRCLLAIAPAVEFSRLQIIRAFDLHGPKFALDQAEA